MNEEFLVAFMTTTSREIRNGFEIAFLFFHVSHSLKIM
jgi:hypothetical protein